LLHERANTLQRLGLLRPGLLTAEEASALFGESGADPRHGALISVRRDPVEGRCTVEGWAYLPQRHAIADAVVLTVDSAATGKPIPSYLILEHTTPSTRDRPGAGEPDDVQSGRSGNRHTPKFQDSRLDIQRARASGDRNPWRDYRSVIEPF
jgi:hypothetical protein